MNLPELDYYVATCCYCNKCLSELMKAIVTCDVKILESKTISVGGKKKIKMLVGLPKNTRNTFVSIAKSTTITEFEIAHN